MIGRRAVTLEGPALEEIIKTLVAVLLGASVVAAHLMFGIVEAVYDYVMEQRTKHTRSRAAAAVLLSITGHTAFGLITVYAGRALGSWQAGTVVAVLAHAAWNRLFVRA